MGIVPLAEILLKVFGTAGGGNVKEQAKEFVTHKLSHQIDRSAWKEAAQVTLKGVESSMDAKGVPEATLDQRIELGKLLAENSALAAAKLPDVIRALSTAQADLERARGTAEETAKRQARETAEETLRQCFIDVGRVLAGEAPRAA